MDSRMKAKFMLRGEEISTWVDLVERDGFKAAPPLTTDFFDPFGILKIPLRLQAVDDGFAYYQIV